MVFARSTQNRERIGRRNRCRHQIARGGPGVLLDYLPKENPVLAYNDFEPGDDNIYVVGPFAQCPTSLDLINDAGDAEEMFKAIGNDFVNSVKETTETIGDVLLSLVAGNADRIAVNKALWDARRFGRHSRRSGDGPPFHHRT
jgi:hypothetical protein